MKKLGILLILGCALSTSACAQWYLFPGKKKQQEQKPATDTLVRKDQPDSARTVIFRDSTLAHAPGEPDDLYPNGNDFDSDLFVLDVPDVIHVALVLPLQASAKQPSTNFLDFYSGALLALRDLGAAGLKADLQVVDASDSKTAVTHSLIDENDVVIGPVSFEDLEAAVPLCSGGKVLVSPLEPKAASLAEAGPVVQAPASGEAQVDELVRWVREELPIGDVFYVVSDTTALQPDGQSAYLIRKLREGDVRFREVSSVRDIPFQRGKKTRVAIASEKDNFITTAVRNLGIEGARNNNVILFGTTRIRTNGITQTDLHNAQTHLAVSYFIDYDDPDVKRFILAYRALFQNEPGSFAFQGYDTMRHFVTMCSVYGRQWYKKLPEYAEKGLQSDFRFTQERPRLNQAVRRIVYNSDLSTTAQQ
ncbi:MAG: amino acid ABC transporter substrate-binding protein [Bacteroidales bacterium]|nr:amino acid ABC transporter substrate-binding protein [Bacteroidales bacterium]